LGNRLKRLGDFIKIDPTIVGKYYVDYYGDIYILLGINCDHRLMGLIVAKRQYQRADLGTVTPIYTYRQLKMNEKLRPISGLQHRLFNYQMRTRSCLSMDKVNELLEKEIPKWTC
jgi:hypothetical protein